MPGRGRALEVLGVTVMGQGTLILVGIVLVVWSVKGRATGSFLLYKRNFLVLLKRRRDVGRDVLGGSAVLCRTVGVFDKATSSSAPHLTLGSLRARNCSCRAVRSSV